MGNKIRDKKDDVTNLGKCALCHKEKSLVLATIKCLGKDGWFEENLMMCDVCIIEENATKNNAKAA